MKRQLLIALILLTALPMMAQVDGESYSKSKKQRYFGVGITGGINHPRYHYGNRPDLNGLPLDTTWFNLLRPIAGVLVEIPIGDDMYFSPELLWINKGDARIFQNKPSGQNITYLARVNYFDLRLPVDVIIPVKGPFQPYLFAGVNVGMVMPYIRIDTLFGKPLESPVELPLSGFISGENGVTELVNASNMAPFDAGVFGGIGGRYTLQFARFSLVMKLEFAYSMGLLNTYSKRELHSEAPAANLGSGGTHYSVWSRYNRGLEAKFSVVLPLHFLGGDACSFGSSRISQRNSHYGF